MRSISLALATTALGVIIVGRNVHAQSEGEETRMCTKAALTLVAELKPHSSTPEMYFLENPAPSTSLRGNANLPRGANPVGESAAMRTEQRGNLAERRAEACYQLAVEIGRHFGLALDGKESYERLREIRFEQKRKSEEPTQMKLHHNSHD